MGQRIGLAGQHHQHRAGQPRVRLLQVLFSLGRFVSHSPQLGQRQPCAHPCGGGHPRQQASDWPIQLRLNLRPADRWPLDIQATVRCDDTRAARGGGMVDGEQAAEGMSHQQGMLQRQAVQHNLVEVGQEDVQE
jgi:hypothetical protein